MLRQRARGLCALSLVLVFGCMGTLGDGVVDEDNGGSGNPDPEADVFVPSEATLHRLTAVQLGNSYVDLLGGLVLPEDLPADDQLYGFTSISAASTTVSPLDVEKYEQAALDVIAQVWDDTLRRDLLVACSDESLSHDCVQEFLSRMATQAWRRPVDAAEIAQLVELAESLGKDLSNPWEGLRYGLAAVLQSPHFLFRVERGEADSDSDHLRYSSWEMASRLSFLITDGPPDELLTEAAAAGDLTNVDNVELHARRLLDTPAARDTLVRFFRDFMGIRGLDQLDKSADEFPMFSATLGPAMRVEIERLFANVVFDKQGDFRQLFTTRDSFINGELAQVYGVTGIEGDEFVAATLPSNRAGLLTTPGFLAMNAHKTATSPTHRGRFVRVNLLCQDIPPPPPGVDTTLPPQAPGDKTLRELLAVHATDPACSACHSLMDPIGFAFENYDAVGAWRDLDNGLPVDATTEVEGVELEGGVELGELIAGFPRLGDCIAQRFYQHATGHLDDKHETLAVDALIGNFVAGDYDFKELVAALVINDGYRYASSSEEVQP